MHMHTCASINLLLLLRFVSPELKVLVQHLCHTFSNELLSLPLAAVSTSKSSDEQDEYLTRSSRTSLHVLSVYKVKLMIEHIHVSYRKVNRSLRLKL